MGSILGIGRLAALSLGQPTAHSEGYGQRRVDGTNEEWLTECGLEFGLPQKCAVLNGFGQNNELAP